MLVNSLLKLYASRLKILTFKYVNFANFILVVLSIFVIFSAFTGQRETLSNEPRKNQFKVRIVEIKPKKFGLDIIANHEGKLIFLSESKIIESKIKVGTLLFLDGEITKFKYNFSATEFNTENFALQNAITGKLKIKKLIAQNCDIICYFIQKNTEFKNYISSQFSYYFCNFYISEIRQYSKQESCVNLQALSEGLVLGGSEKFDELTKEKIRNLGLSHIVAVSGYNIGLVYIFTMYLTNFVNINFNIKSILFFLILAFFLGLVGPSPAVIRAVLMFTIMLIAKIVYRNCSALRALFLASIIILLFNPYTLFSISFQLSFLATLSLIILGSNKYSQNKTINFISELIFTSLACFLYTAVVIINNFGNFSLFSVVSNLIVLPFIPLITILNFLTIIPLIGYFIAFITTLIQAWLLDIVSLMSNFLPYLKLNTLNFTEILAWYFFASLALFCIKFKFKSNFDKTHKRIFFNSTYG